MEGGRDVPLLRVKILGAEEGAVVGAAAGAGAGATAISVDIAEGRRGCWGRIGWVVESSGS